ncbi:hypothetical protein DLAC_05917 [Tieghemostelium lacteum]|uniref:Uncharacterized protein n=1 Tax=Tieghemostelium lacteum TaxID=361077 RepID=A0A151ZH07_TIELA|nr:hypothetical protein DLAC_05917 [Tieghemostelium lacteum]|eukprot:KYQ93261.1 hypothetical protein DLAC_05917 [Tieghemostelium lacteum]
MSETNNNNTASYHKEGILGCKHYPRNCKLKAACCGKLFVCRLCHDDEIKQHNIDRFKTQEVQCMKCFMIQPVSNKCFKCQCEFARYHCPVCKFYDDTPDKAIYHCDKCGICRVGNVDKFQHCDRCRMCIDKKTFEKHVCTQDKYSDNCPICLEDLFSSRDPVTTMQCGHPIHVECQKQYIKQQHYNCPICKKSIVAIDWKATERQIKNFIMPPRYSQSTCSILCNDCQFQTEDIPFHFMGHKCSKCGSFNTYVTKKNLIIDENASDEPIINNPPQQQQQEGDENDEEEEDDEDDEYFSDMDEEDDDNDEDEQVNQPQPQQENNPEQRE